MAKPLDFLHKNNNQDEWAKRYVASKMGIEPAPADATYTNAMDKISIQSQPSSQYSLYNRDRIDDETQQIIDAALGSAIPSHSMAGYFSREKRNLINRLRKAKNLAANPQKESRNLDYRSYKEIYNSLMKRAKKDKKLSKLGTLEEYNINKTKQQAKNFKKSKIIELIERNKIPEAYGKKPSYYEKLSIDELKDVLVEHFGHDLGKSPSWEYMNLIDILKGRAHNLPKKQSGGIVGMQHGGPVFNPESSGYDMQTALAAGLERDERGHMGSLDPRTGMVLKGRLHESWNPMAQTEMSLGNTIEYDPDEGRYFSVPGGMYESAPADETAHDQMNNLIFENEIKQSQGASPLSFLNRDRIDSQNQAIMDAVMSMSVPAAGALSMGKSAFGKLADFPKSRVLSQIPVNKEIQKVNWNRMVRDRLPKSADKALQNIKDLSWLEDLIKRNQ